MNIVKIMGHYSVDITGKIELYVSRMRIMNVTETKASYTWTRTRISKSEMGKINSRSPDLHSMYFNTFVLDEVDAVANATKEMEEKMRSVLGRLIVSTELSIIHAKKALIEKCEVKDEVYEPY